MHAHAQLFKLHLIPIDKLTHTVLEVAGGNGPERAAEHIALVVKIDLTAALRRAACGLKAAGASADDDDMGGLAYGGDFHMGLKAGVGVYRAGDLRAAAEYAADALLGAEDARADILAAAFADLVGPLRVGDALTAELDEVERALLKLPDGGLDSQRAGVYHGLGYVGACGFGNMLKHVVADVLRGEYEVVCLVGTRVGVEHVNARGLKDGENIHAVGQVERARILVVERNSEEYREAGADDLAHGLNYLDCKAAAVLHTSAVLVGPAVPLRGEELLDEVCVVRVYFDRVKAALEGEVRRDLVVFDALLYLFL